MAKKPESNASSRSRSSVRSTAVLCDVTHQAQVDALRDAVRSFMRAESPKDTLDTVFLRADSALSRAKDARVAA